MRRRRGAVRRFDPSSAKGFSNQDIARLVGIGVDGVKDHHKNIYSILEVSSRTEAATQAVNLGIISV